MFDNTIMTFDKKILAGFISCSVVLLVVAVISFKNSEKFLSTNLSVNHTHRVLYEFEQILLRTVDAESGVRGFVLSGRESFLDLYAESRKAVFDHIDNTRRLMEDRDARQLNLDALEKIVRQRVNHFEKTIEIVKAGKLNEAQELVASGEGKQMQDEIRSLVGKARESEQALLAERAAASQRDAETFNTLFITLLFVIALVLCIVYFIIIRNVQALRKAEAEASEKNWSLTGSTDLVKRMQGNKSVRELSQNIISSLASYLDLPAGALYVKDRNNLKLRIEGTHALDLEKNQRAFIEPGEGLAGQAAFENKQILLHDVKSHAYDINTSFGSIRPATVLAIPLAFENKVVGVVELGSTTGFSQQQRRFLENVSDSIAIGLTSAQSREEIKDLLEETQRQAEELEAQQHELRQANEELQAKTELLEQSEAILKTQQEELQQANLELEEKANMLEDQKQKLEKAKHDIELKAQELGMSSKYKSEFLANMSHELRTPLNSILILSQLLSENKNKRLSDKEVDHAKNIYRSGSDLLNLINEILDLSRIEAGKMSLDISQFEVSEIVNTLHSTFNEVGKSRSVTFEVSSNNDHITLHSDKQRIEQILKNLLSNAFKFTSHGGKVTLNIEDYADSISFSVIDTGIGIPDDKKQIIFEAFQQADGSTKRKYGGTGLGLSISRDLATVLGGTILLETEEGKGSTFRLHLPKEFNEALNESVQTKIEVKPVAQAKSTVKIVPPASVGSAEPDDDRNDIHERDRVVLIIEDDLKFALMLLNFIRERKYKGIIALQGTTGISYARHYRPDAIFLDMNLPVMNGYEVLNRLKTDPDLRHIPVQIISGFDDHQKESLALGAFDYLMKPVALTDLHKAFDRIENFANKKLKKLLVIEDNVEQNNAIRELIGNGDVKSFSAYSGTEAQQAMMTEAFDCIIVDLGLPDMSGFELLEKIKANAKLNTIPIIVYTGRDLNKEETKRLQKLSDTVVLKTANSHERLLDETILFLHRVEARLPKEKQLIIRKLHRTDEVLKGKLILLVDDDIRNIYSLANLLDEEGITCLTAENGRLAIDLLNANPRVDLVLMDIMMPEMDGYEATALIRKDERFKKLPIIALTAKAMKGDKEKCLAAGMSDYVSKPVNADQLLSLMRVWLYK